jgi:hypothetical protein
MLYRSLQPGAAMDSGSGEILQDSRTIRLKAFKGDDWYNISLDHKTCDCPNFQTKADGCEHLTTLGIHRLRPFTPTTHPTFSISWLGPSSRQPNRSYRAT